MKKMFLKLLLLSLWRLDGVFGDYDEVSVSVTEGDSVTLNSGLTEMKNDEVIQWRFGNTSIAEINVTADSFTVYNDVLDGRFRDRLKLDNQTGSLTITNTRTEHAGDYELQINSMRRSFILVVSDSVSMTGLISAAAAGSLLIVAAVGIFCICKKCRKTDQEVETREEEITYVEAFFHKRKAQKLVHKEEDRVVYAPVANRR